MAEAKGLNNFWFSFSFLLLNLQLQVPGDEQRGGDPHPTDT